MNDTKPAATSTPANDSRFTEPNLEAAHRIGRSASATVFQAERDGAVPFLVVGKDHRVEDIAKFLPPKRTAVHANPELSSFLRYVQDFRTKELRVFAQATERPTVRAEFDYLAQPTVDAIAGAPSATALKGAERVHNATFSPSVSPEWTAWVGMLGKSIGQKDFAEFLDEWGYCCAEPDAATMLELAMTLQAHQTSNMKSSIKLKDGSGHYDHKISIETSAGTSGELKVPDTIRLKLPWFEGGDQLEVEFRVRIRIESGSAKFQLLGQRLHDVKRRAIGDIIKKVEETLKLPVYLER